MSSNDVVSEIKRGYIYRLAELGKRIDGRRFDEHRPLIIEKSPISSAEGSARVKLGKTDVLIGIKMEPGEPYPDTPNSGVMTTSAEMGPVASPTFESGPPGEDAIELARVTDRAIREGEVIDLEALCIEPEKKVWIVFIDIHVLDYDGNLFDACQFGALAALSSTIVPAEKFGLGKDFPLKIQHYPVSVTFAKIRDKILCDPGLDEEKIADARITISLDENNNIRAVQKGLRGGFSQEEIKKIINMAVQITPTLRKKILEV